MSTSSPRRRSRSGLAGSGAATLAQVQVALRRPGSRVFVLTGAGISVAAGLPTYRGTDGLYAAGSFIPLHASDARSKTVTTLWDRLADLYTTAARCDPTPAHRALARAQDHHEVAVATQNIDGLHARAGAFAWELHGTVATARCLNPACRTRVELATLAAPVTETRCVACHARLRPDVVLFGERLDEPMLTAARKAAAAADVVIAAGTSLQVSPAVDLVVHALGCGAVGVWLEADPAGMLEQVPVELRPAVSQLVPVPGDVQSTLPALLSHLPATPAKEPGH